MYCILENVVCVLVSQSTVFDPAGWSQPGSSVHGILQARILEWPAMPSSRGSSLPRDRTRVSCISCTADGFFTAEPPGKPLEELANYIILNQGHSKFNAHLEDAGVWLRSHRCCEFQPQLHGEHAYNWKFSEHFLNYWHSFAKTDKTVKSPSTGNLSFTRNKFKFLTRPVSFLGHWAIFVFFPAPDGIQLRLHALCDLGKTRSIQGSLTAGDSCFLHFWSLNVFLFYFTLLRSCFFGFKFSILSTQS